MLGAVLMEPVGICCRGSFAAILFLALTGWLVAEEAGSSDLFRAIDSGDLGRLTLLLGSASPNVTLANGETPLMLAARAGNFEMCRALLWAGADPNATDKAGKRPRDYLQHDAAGFSAVNLLLRCYAFAAQHHSPT